MFAMNFPLMKDVQINSEIQITDLDELSQQSLSTVIKSRTEPLDVSEPSIPENKKFFEDEGNENFTKCKTNKK